MNKSCEVCFKRAAISGGVCSVCAAPKSKPKRPCVVCNGPKYRTIVLTDDGLMIDCTSSMQAGHPVGTRGTVQYVSGASFGLYFFTANSEDVGQ